ncbi:hypothetical protein RFI_15646, partial [Reticulomyxa filosa]
VSVKNTFQKYQLLPKEQLQSISVKDLRAVELHVDAHLPSKLLQDKDLEVTVLKWKNSKNRGSQAHYKLTKIRQQHSDILDDFEKDQILKPQQKTEEMERDTILLGYFLK